MPYSLVRCRSDFTYAQTPVQFFWEGVWWEVQSVLQAWRTPEGRAFQVRREDGNEFRLYYVESQDTWQINPIGTER